MHCGAWAREGGGEDVTARGGLAAAQTQLRPVPFLTHPRKRAALDSGRRLAGAAVTASNGRLSAYYYDGSASGPAISLASCVVVNKYRDSNQGLAANWAPAASRPGELPREWFELAKRLVVFERRAGRLGTACLLSVVMDGLPACHRRVDSLQGYTAGSLSQHPKTTASSTRQFRIKINPERSRCSVIDPPHKGRPMPHVARAACHRSGDGMEG
jgi:hypothetical protein